MGLVSMFFYWKPGFMRKICKFSVYMRILFNLIYVPFPAIIPTFRPDFVSDE